MTRFRWLLCLRSCRAALDSALRQARSTPRPPCSLRPLSLLLAAPQGRSRHEPDVRR